MRSLPLAALALALAVAPPARAQTPSSFVAVPPGATPGEVVRLAASVTPSPRQLAWQELEMTAFLHFGINTFTDREWGDGSEDPALFAPSALDARQWMRVLRDAGVRLVILTAKHHDGFCLWPSRFTEHSVKNSPWKNGQGDVVREAAEAAREYGLKFGVYLSPWDRNAPSYGDSPRYNEYFANQLRELLTSYGPIDEVWFDGAKGDNVNQEYDWERYYSVVRELQPRAVIAVRGPDVRWVGTESGYGRETEWSVVGAPLPDPALARAGILMPPVEPQDRDLGSRDRLREARALFWYPSEVDVSIRPGWFYHPAEDARVKSLSRLVDIYYSSVGRNSVLLLNVPPDRRGLIHENDAARLRELRRVVDETFARNLAAGARIQASSAGPGHAAAAMLDADSGSYWMAAAGDTAAVLTFQLPAPVTFDRLLLQERIRVGQRIARFALEGWDGAAWRPLVDGTTVGYKRLLRFPATTTDRVRLRIESARSSPTLSAFGLFRAPEVPGEAP
jgi:alpha-L-fucosidase